ncbi:hypothetical protein F5Y16DRAFT_395364 [Xylariaceae sp. FL0255]|nr:hypothetical protein F5Y16DRAFT_395364 [Xylariaceae sp. FL0255]
MAYNSFGEAQQDADTIWPEMPMMGPVPFLCMNCQSQQWDWPVIMPSQDTGLAYPEEPFNLSAAGQVPLFDPFLLPEPPFNLFPIEMIDPRLLTNDVQPTSPEAIVSLPVSSRLRPRKQRVVADKRRRRHKLETRAFTPNEEISDISEAISEPLSKLAELFAEVKLIDIETFVNRGAEMRIGTFSGRIKRPLNSFVLYRKKYGPLVDHMNKMKREKAPNLQNKLSEVIGLSWRHYETDEVRAEFERLASIEKTNHYLAFPDYKLKLRRSRKRAPAMIVNDGSLPDSTESDLCLDSITVKWK